MFKPGDLVRLNHGWTSWEHCIVYACSQRNMLGKESDKLIPGLLIKNAIAEVIALEAYDNIVVHWPQFNCYNTFFKSSLRYANATIGK